MWPHICVWGDEKRAWQWRDEDWGIFELTADIPFITHKLTTGKLGALLCLLAFWPQPSDCRLWFQWHSVWRTENNSFTLCQVLCLLISYLLQRGIWQQQWSLVGKEICLESPVGSYGPFLSSQRPVLWLADPWPLRSAVDGAFLCDSFHSVFRRTVKGHLSIRLGIQ